MKSAAFLRQAYDVLRRTAVQLWRFIKEEATSEITLWMIALVVGLASGCAAIAMRVGISELQHLFYGADDLRLHSVAGRLDWRLVLGIPVAGGVLIGLLLHFFAPDRRFHSVADVIEASAIKEARVSFRDGWTSALGALLTLSMGGSTGREGPVVHIGATIASWMSDKLDATRITRRDILGCAAAAAVSASFNAPIAGALFALEVILRHYAVRSFGPIVIASVTGAVASRLYSGNFTEYLIPEHSIAFYQEIPAFMLLGVVSAMVASILMRAIFLTDDFATFAQTKLRIPLALRPPIAGALLGLLAIEFPEVIGVGYETAVKALRGYLDVQTLVVVAVAKVAAVAITFAGRFGGGIFSPSLMVGALVGAAFGEIATDVFPSVSGSVGLYALAGLGAVAGAVLGAPISTTLIVFELTGDFQAGIAVMIAVSTATVATHRMFGKSFFLAQLERRKLRIADGPESYMLRLVRVKEVMRPRGAENSASDTACQQLIEQGAWVTQDDTLQKALPMLEGGRAAFIPVAEPPPEDSEEQPELIGAVFLVDALKAYNRLLIEAHKEEHS